MDFYIQNQTQEPSAVPLMLDVYVLNTNSTDRPVLMFIHGSSFTGGIKHKPEIIEMGKYYLRPLVGVYVSIDYRKLEEAQAILTEYPMRKLSITMMVLHLRNG